MKNDIEKIREELRHQIRQLESALTTLDNLKKMIIETENNLLRAIDKITDAEAGN